MRVLKIRIGQNLVQACLFSALLLPTFTTEAQPVASIAAGEYHSLFLRSDGSLWVTGRNYEGQLGYNTLPLYLNLPAKSIASGVTAIAAGGDSSLFLKSDGSLWAMGYNQFGQLGDGTYGTAYPFGTSHPEPIVTNGVRAIAAGSAHSLFLKNDGSLWGMGDNRFGQLGGVLSNGTNQPGQIVASNVTAIAAGGWHSLFLKSDGSLWGMGDNQFGQLGDGTTNNVNLPEQIVASNVTAIAVGVYHTLFIKSDGSLWAMGENLYGELGDGSTKSSWLPEQIIASNVVAVTAGFHDSLFIKSDGSLWGMGYDSYGQLGNGIFNQNYPNQPEQIAANEVRAIAAGWYHSLFIKNDGSLWTMGLNGYGQLGDNTYNQTNSPQKVVTIPAGYNQISGKVLSGGKISLSFVGLAGSYYELDRSDSLASPNWVPQATNFADAKGLLAFTNTPNQSANNFWRIRAAPH